VLSQPPNKQCRCVALNMLGSGISTGAHSWPLPVALAAVICLSSRYAAAEPPSEPVTVTPEAPASQPRDPVPLLAYVLGAIGLSGVSVGATTGFLALDQKATAEDHCSPTLRRCDATGREATLTGRTLRDVSTAGWIVGGLGIGLGAYLWLSPATSRRAVAVAVLTDGASPEAAFVARF
jgi:hypothetical protein